MSSKKRVVAETEGLLDTWGCKAFFGPPRNRLGSAIARLASPVFHPRQHHGHGHSAIHLLSSGVTNIDLGAQPRIFLEFTAASAIMFHVESGGTRRDALPVERFVCLHHPVHRSTASAL
jgi:hypothetical protein